MDGKAFDKETSFQPTLLQKFHCGNTFKDPPSSTDCRQLKFSDYFISVLALCPVKQTVRFQYMPCHPYTSLGTVNIDIISRSFNSSWLVTLLVVYGPQ